MVHVSECDSSENAFQQSSENPQKDLPSTSNNQLASVQLQLGPEVHQHTQDDDGLATENDACDRKETQDSVRCKCSCHFTNKICSYDINSMESTKFRDLLLLHLDLIEQQNITIQRKDKIIQQMKT